MDTTGATPAPAAEAVRAPEALRANGSSPSRAGTGARHGVVNGERPYLVTGALAVAVLFAGTRWISYVGVQPVFIGDVLMAAAVLQAAARSALHREQFAPRVSQSGTTAFVLMLVTYVTFRFLLGQDFSFDAVRDAAPYFYAGLALLGYFGIRRASPSARRRTVRLLVAALAFHAAWYTVVWVFPALPDAMPIVSSTQQLHIFFPRPDVDCALLGVLAALVLWRLLHRSRHPLWLSLAYLACWAPIVGSLTRAGLLGALTANLFVVVGTLAEGGRPALSKARLLLAVVFAVVLGTAVLAQSEVGTKFVATVDPTAVDQTLQGGTAEGTTRARANAWGHLTDWTFSDQGRATVGVGYGPDFLTESGATFLLVNSEVGGDTIPRSPHNYWLNTLARMGLVGLGMLALVVLQFLRRAWRLRSTATGDPLILLLVLTPLSLLLPATLGVVLESPFGAIPFWWTLGAVLGLPRTGSAGLSFAALRRHRIDRHRVNTLAPGRRAAEGQGLPSAASAPLERR